MGCSKPGWWRSCFFIFKTCFSIRTMGEILCQYPLQPFAHPGVPRQFVSRPLCSPCLLTHSPSMHQSCFRLCAGGQGHTDKQDRHVFPTPEAVAHLSRFHPEISLRKSMLSKRAPAASAPPPDGVNKDSNTVVYPKESGRKPAQDFREVARYKINVYKQPAEVIMLAKIPFAM